VYTDPRTHTIRYLSNASTRVIAGTAFDDVENQGGAFVDGAGPDARFNNPMGIARDVNGGFVVADAGNRRIRRLSPFDERTFASPLGLGTPFPPLTKATYNVLLAGNSFAWSDTDWQTSIGGELQDRLNAANAGMPVRVVTLPNMALPAAESYFREVLEGRPIDLVVLLMNSSTPEQSYGIETLPTKSWMTPMTHGLQSIRTSLPGARFVAVIHPYPWEYSASESVYVRFFEFADGGWLYPSPSFHDELLSVSHDAQLDTLDLWPVFAKAEVAANHPPYFGTEKYHLTPAGRTVAADAIARHLIAEKPWSH
jgi:hypothetical protein